MDKLKQIKGPVWVVIAGAIVSIGLVGLGTMKGLQEKKLSELPSVFISFGILIVVALIMTRAVHCVHKGGCDVFSWVLAIFIALLYILPTGLLARFGFASLQEMLSRAIGKVKEATPLK